MPHRNPALPNSRPIRWLVACGVEADAGISACLLRGLYRAVPIFLGGIINSIAIAATAALRNPTAPFVLWLLVEILLGATRFIVMLVGRRALSRGKSAPVALSVLLSCAWAASIGFGAFISILSQDWVLATITCLSATGMVCGICLRNHGTPRLVATMMILSLAPPAIAAALSTETIMLVVALQLPLYVATMSMAAFQLNRVLVSRMLAQQALEQSEALIRSILESSPDYTILLDSDQRVVFCSTPERGNLKFENLMGVPWLDLLPLENAQEATQVLAAAAHGATGRLTVVHDDGAGRRCLDLVMTPLQDESERTLIVARDVTEQKISEDRAIWMANHDALTGLPNRLLFQDRLDAVCLASEPCSSGALMVLDVDNFKLINDTLGHDAGDALLCAFADRLTRAVGAQSVVARLGGDEFAILLKCNSDADIQETADRIFAELRFPFRHEGRLMECNASIGASLYPRDGSNRSEMMKAADMALYAAKSAGRGRIRVFSSAMRKESESRSLMMSLATRATASRSILAHYQPKLCLLTGSIQGFEALLRWRDNAGKLRSPAEFHPAFEDPKLAGSISTRMIDQVLSDVRGWLDDDIEFVDVALNAAAAEFRDGSFADFLLERLAVSAIPPSRLQIEVAETNFLGRSADYVESALRKLSDEGVKVALDNFGTGHASLSHLMQFPIDVLKIDRSFVREIGRDFEASAIIKAMVKLGQNLDIQVIAEGVETAEQAAHLLALECQTGQGYYFFKAVEGKEVGKLLRRREVSVPRSKRHAA